MDAEVLITRVQQRGRLHGRQETRRAICAVTGALGEVLPATVFHRIAARLPDDIHDHIPQPVAAITNVRDFLARIGERLFVDGPDAAFLARVVLEQLNADRHALTPSAVAHLVAPDLRPLLTSRRPGATPQPTATDVQPALVRRMQQVGANSRPAPRTTRPRKAALTGN